MLYFAYGSNMSTPRIVERVPSTTFHSVATLPGYVMKFNKHSVDGSAKCNIENTGKPDDVVHGVVFNLLAEEKPWLDHYEGLGHGYDAIDLTVQVGDGKELEVYAYIGRDLDESIKPYHWYKEHVLRGAREHRLPEDYIYSIEAVKSMTDPDPSTSERELSIYLP
jgi:hypothetical protein